MEGLCHPVAGTGWQVELAVAPRFRDWPATSYVYVASTHVVGLLRLHQPGRSAFSMWTMMTQSRMWSSATSAVTHERRKRDCCCCVIRCGCTGGRVGCRRRPPFVHRCMAPHRRSPSTRVRVAVLPACCSACNRSLRWTCFSSIASTTSKRSSPLIAPFPAGESPLM